MASIRREEKRHKFFRWFYVLLLLAGLFGELKANAQPVSAEYKLKAVFLFNFIQFVDWPEDAFATTNSPIIVGILGRDPFGKTLDEVVEGELVKGRKIEVRRLKTKSEIQTCHAVFISQSLEENLQPILESLKGRSILTVGDFPGFADKGGMIRFIKEKNKIRFRVNVQAVKEARLSLSAKLLQLAEIVPEKRP